MREVHVEVRHESVAVIVSNGVQFGRHRERQLRRLHGGRVHSERRTSGCRHMFRSIVSTNGFVKAADVMDDTFSRLLE